MHTVRLYSRKAPAIQGGRLLTVHLIHGHGLSSALGKLPGQERSHPYKRMYIRDHSDAATTQLINQIPGEQCATGHISCTPSCDACTEAVTRVGSTCNSLTSTKLFIGDIATSSNSPRQISAQQGISRLTALRNSLRRQLQESKRDHFCTAAGAGQKTLTSHQQCAQVLPLPELVISRIYTQTGAVHATY